MVKAKEESRLRVIEARQADVSFGRARLDAQTQQALGLEPGDIIEIKGTQTTSAVVWRGDPQDTEPGTIRLDSLTRKNAGVKLSDKVAIKKIEPKEAKRIVLTPALEQAHELQFGPGVEDLIKRNMLRRTLNGGDIVIVPNLALFGNAIPFKVINTTPVRGTLRVTDETTFQISDEGTQEVTSQNRVAYEDIGGLGEQLRQVREVIELPLRHPELFDTLGIDPPKGVLLRGPPGTGKTLIAQAVANEVGAHFQVVNGPEIMSKFYGSSEQNLRNIFETAKKNSPAIIFFDEIDSIASKRDDKGGGGEVENRVVSQLLTLMDGLEKTGKIMVLAATNRPDSMDQALRRPGRFDREIEIGVPNEEGREEILTIHSRSMPLEEGINLKKFAKTTHGFVGADLAALCREAAMKALQRYLPDIDLDEPIPVEVLENMHITETDFQHALSHVEPSALREFFMETPSTGWEDIGGLEDVKQRLKESVEWPLEDPERFTRLGINPPKGVMLYGPPGTGKTALAKAVAHETGANFISVKGPELLSKWVGESEKALREVFKKAKQSSPTIIFFDEIDAIASMRGDGGDAREGMVNQLLTLMDGMENMENVMILAATNRPDIIDAGLLRAGRFDRLVKVSAPDPEARKAIFEIYLKKMPINKNVKAADLADQVKGYVGADIEALCREAAMIALREDDQAKEVNKSHFEEAIRTVRSSVTEEVVKYYDRMEEALNQAPGNQATSSRDSMTFL